MIRVNKMQIKEYKFDNRTDICNFIESIKDIVIGKNIKTAYSIYGMWGDTGEWPVVMVFDDFAVGISYEIVNKALIEIVPEELLSDYVDSFDGMLQEAEGFPFKGKSVERISVNGFSKSYETNGATGARAPEGGDYFSTIRFHMENGIDLCLCGASAICDGWMDVWIEDDNDNE